MIILPGGTAQRLMVSKISEVNLFASLTELDYND